LEGYLFEGQPLPGETVAYVAAVAPRLGGSPAHSGPLAVYASATPEASSDDLNRRSLAGALPAMPGGVAVLVPATVDAGDASDTSSDDLNRKALMAAWPQPSRPLSPAPAVTLATTVAPPSQAPRAGVAPAGVAPASVAPASVAPAGVVASGRWGVQVGAFSSPGQARAAAEAARLAARGSLDAAETAVGSVARPDGTVLYRARLIGVSTDAASDGCDRLTRAQMACVVISPDAQT
jgi:cell division protein FtsN